MLRKTLVSLVVCMGLTTVSLSADNNKLKEEMGTLSSDVVSLEIGFLSNNTEATLAAAKTLRENVDKYLGNKESITKLLPADVKHKASIAINSAQMIEKNIKIIEDAIAKKDMRLINRQMTTQKAFLEIQNQCFRCHNLVRDWK